MASRNAAYSAVRGGSSPYDDPMMTRKKGGGDDDEDELSDIMKEGVDEVSSTSDIHPPSAPGTHFTTLL